ncbi:MAG TPA: twin-arginine translocase subunit TatC, partial [Methylophilaceae bacterium]|nr:twin-arginine translocase subunit TatC [Methylophilaceae bacterium]
TPPDIISQFMLAIPLWMLFEMGLLVSQLTTPKQNSIKI